MLKKYYIILLMLTTALAVNAQSNYKGSDTTIYIYTDTVPAFPGGDIAMVKYIGKGLRGGSKGPNGEYQTKVTAEFIVEKDGSLSNCHIVRPLNTLTEKGLLQVLKASPRWKPATNGGKKVRALYTIPVSCIMFEEE